MNISRLSYRYFLLLYITFVSALIAYPISNDDVDQDVRHNPNISTQEQQKSKLISQYSFINYHLNYINLNGRSWTSLIQRINQSRQKGIFKVVHIGDSHIQAEGSTSIVREKLQDFYGDAGRGLVIPYRLAGTNQPLDYRITSSISHTTAKLLKKPWATDMGFTGISISTPDFPFTLSISNVSTIDAITIHGYGDIDVTSITTNGGHKIGFRTTTQSHKGVTVHLADSAHDHIDITVNAHKGTIYGIELKRDHHGVLYSAIGNNGATFSTYNEIPDFANGIQALNPDLIIIALGTNEAFGNISDDIFYNQINSFVDNIRHTNPLAELLLVTPSECQRSVHKTITSGSKRKRRRRRVRSFAINANISRMASVIRRFGAEKHIPVYDFYNIAGGKGASDKWLKNRLLSNDRIHRTWAGYRIEGELLTQALNVTFRGDSQLDNSYQRDDVQHLGDEPISNVSYSNKSNHQKETETAVKSTNKKAKQQIAPSNKQSTSKVKHSYKNKKRHPKSTKIKKQRQQNKSKVTKNKKR